jgi:hypothetical protein
VDWALALALSVASWVRAARSSTLEGAVCTFCWAWGVVEVEEGGVWGSGGWELRTGGWLRSRDRLGQVCMRACFQCVCQQGWPAVYQSL